MADIRRTARRGRALFVALVGTCAVIGALACAEVVHAYTKPHAPKGTPK